MDTVNSRWIKSGNNIYNGNSSNVGVGSSPSYLFDVNKSSIGTTNTMRIGNSDNTNISSHAKMLIQSGGSSAGDAYINFKTENQWSIGIDNDASDIFRIVSSFDAMGATNSRLSINMSGNIFIPAITSAATEDTLLAWKKSTGEIIAIPFPAIGGGTVTSIAQGLGMLNSVNPITTTGTVGVDSTKVVLFNDTIGTGATGKIETKYHATTTFEPILTKGNLTENITGMQFNNTRQVIGGAAELSLSGTYFIPQASDTTWWGDDPLTTNELDSIRVNYMGKITTRSDEWIRNDTIYVDTSFTRIYAGTGISVTGTYPNYTVASTITQDSSKWNYNAGRATTWQKYLSNVGIGTDTTSHSKVTIFGNKTTNNLLYVSNDLDECKDSSFLYDRIGRGVFGGGLFICDIDPRKDINTKLSVMGSQVIHDSLFFGSAIGSESYAGLTLSSYENQINDNVDIAAKDNGALTITTNDNDGVSGHISLMPDGNVGIGTTNPDTNELKIYGNKTTNNLLNATNDITGTDSSFIITKLGGQIGGYIYVDSADINSGITAGMLTRNIIYNDIDNVGYDGAISIAAGIEGQILTLFSIGTGYIKLIETGTNLIIDGSGIHQLRNGANITFTYINNKWYQISVMQK